LSRVSRDQKWTKGENCHLFFIYLLEAGEEKLSEIMKKTPEASSPQPWPEAEHRVPQTRPVQILTTGCVKRSSTASFSAGSTPARGRPRLFSDLDPDKRPGDKGKLLLNQPWAGDGKREVRV
jgi:hypothetical protein